VSVPRHDEWLAEGGVSASDADSRLPMPGDRREGSLFGPSSFGAPARGPQFLAPDKSSSLVRPYAVTGGRTKPSYQLQIEAMVSASHYEARDLSSLSPECQSILGYCRDWRSVA